MVVKKGEKVVEVGEVGEVGKAGESDGGSSQTHSNSVLGTGRKCRPISPLFPISPLSGPARKSVRSNVVRAPVVLSETET